MFSPIIFPLSGVETYCWLPPLVAFVISAFTSMSGISGAFLLLPFQISVLGFDSPAVSPTNLFYNVVAIPGGVYGYFREKRMVWPLAGVMTCGALPGIFIGVIIRIRLLPDPKDFKLFAGCVLLYLGFRILQDVVRGKTVKAASVDGEERTNAKIAIVECNLFRVAYKFAGRTYSISTIGLFAVSLLVGLMGGIYGVGGGAFMAPILLIVYKLPVQTIAGPALFSTFVASSAGVLIYTFVAPYFVSSFIPTNPDLVLGFLFGLGGFAGIYIGARLQKRMPLRFIKSILMVLVLAVSLRYIMGYFML